MEPTVITKKLKKINGNSGSIGAVHLPTLLAFLLKMLST